MLITHSEKNSLPFNGTIIDFETIGNFCNRFQDSRRYCELNLAIFSYINKDELKIFCAKGEEDIPELEEKTKKVVQSLEKPFFAYNGVFEMGLLFHSCGINVEFDGDLMKEKVPGAKWENKREACAKLSLSRYNDPCNGFGRDCSLAWKQEDWDKAIKHNRSCLLTERDILLKRGYRKPDPFVFHPI